MIYIYILYTFGLTKANNSFERKLKYAIDSMTACKICVFGMWTLSHNKAEILYPPGNGSIRKWWIKSAVEGIQKIKAGIYTQEHYDKNSFF